MRYKYIIKFLISFFILVTFVAVALSNEGAPKRPKEILNVERKLLPPEVFKLFYAVKDSLDYGHIEGITEKKHPKKKLLDYERVTPELMSAFSKKFKILKYEVAGDNYELIIEDISNPKIKYKATRMEKYKLEKDNWISLGGYKYF